MVRGISMFPTFNNNQLLIAKSINNYQDIKVNDIVVCEIEGNTIIKRVKYIQNQYVYYYFDSNTSEIKIIDKNTYQYLSTHPIASNKTLIQKIINKINIIAGLYLASCFKWLNMNFSSNLRKNQNHFYFFKF